MAKIEANWNEMVTGAADEIKMEEEGASATPDYFFFAYILVYQTTQKMISKTHTWHL